MSKQLIKNILFVSILVAGGGANTVYAANGHFSAFSSTEEQPLSFEEEVPIKSSTSEQVIFAKPVVSPQVAKIDNKSKEVVFKQNPVVPPVKVASQITASQPIKAPDNSKTQTLKAPESVTIQTAKSQLLEAEKNADRIKLAKEQAEKEYLANINKARLLKEQLAAAEKAEKQQQKIAEQQAKIKAREEAKAKKAAEWQAYLAAQEKQREDARLAKEAERLAKEQLKAEAKRKEAAEREAALKILAEREAALKAEAERKAVIEREAILKAEAERKAIIEREAAIKAEAARKVVAEREASMKAEAERKAIAERELAMKAQIEAQRKPVPVATNTISSVSTYPAQTKYTIPTAPMKPLGTTPLQRATSVFGVSSAKGSPIRQQILGYSASVDQIKAFEERYKYDSSRMSVLPKQIASIQLNPVLRLNGDQLTMFKTAADKAAVEEYMAYHPLHAEVLSNYIKRVMTLNDGQTNGVNIDAALMNELTFNLGSIGVPSASMNNAPDIYLYISSRLNENDRVKFWNCVNDVRIGDQIQVPSWVKLVDVMYSH